ncbi:MAG: hypothetical protein RLZZ156_69 [Deinococcota bacterium]|jgi:hypothetical protein
MRTTVRLNDQLLADAKKFALAHNQTLTDLIENSLRQMIQAKHIEVKELPTWDLGKPLVDLDFSDTSAIEDFLDQGTNVHSRR